MSKNEEKYKKNSHHIYDLLMKIGNQKKAIKFASKLAEIHNSENHSENKPTTSIYKLVESLNEYLKLK